MSKSFIAIDWGSSNLRAFHINDGTVINSISLEKGVKRINSKEEYPQIIKDIIKSFNIDDTTPVILSGMVGGAAGWKDTPYTSCPFNLKNISNQLIPISEKSNINNPIYHYSGLSFLEEFSGKSGVMRGEEVQLIGALTMDNYDLVILPGTHSKWVNIDHNKTATITSFSTIMTGELFELLLNNSLLGADANKTTFTKVGFQQGIEVADKNSNIIEALFLTRSQLLLEKMTADDSASFLSGLLISNEIKNKLTALKQANKIALTGPSKLNDLYNQVLNYYKIDNIQFLAIEEITTAGYNTIYNDNFR